MAFRVAMEQSCVSRGFTGCCPTNGNTQYCILGSSNSYCYCDQDCYTYNDCCPDIRQINCLPEGGMLKLNKFPFENIDSNNRLGYNNITDKFNGIM